MARRRRERELELEQTRQELTEVEEPEAKEVAEVNRTDATAAAHRTESISITVAQWRDAVNAQTELVGDLRVQVLNLQAELKEREAQLYVAIERLRAISHISRTT